MSGYCRICHQENRGNTDTLVACNNCGSLACDLHHTWWNDSKNSFCTECFPIAMVNSLNNSAGGLQSMKDDNLASEHYRGAVERILEERKLSLDQLIEILHRVSAEILRRKVG